MSRVGREGSEVSIKPEKNLTGKLLLYKYRLQILLDKYLLSAVTNIFVPVGRREITNNLAY